MTRLIIKILLFCLPFLLINLILLSRGFIFQSKAFSDVKVLIDHSDHTNKLNILIFGTSRTNLGIVPRMIDNEFRSCRVSSSTLNLGLDGHSPAVGLKYMLDNKYLYCDLLIVEIYPGLRPMACTTLNRDFKPWTSELNSRLVSLLDRYCILQHGDQVLKYLFKRNPVRASLLHQDGWTETHFCSDSIPLQRAKNKWAHFINADYPAEEQIRDYSDFVSLLKEISALNPNARFVFLRMPVNGGVLENDRIACRLFDPFLYLRLRFPHALIIDATSDPRLKSNLTAEDSHLNAADANRFSAELGQILAEWYFQQPATQIPPVQEVN
jgi:hypothetical protein